MSAEPDQLTGPSQKSEHDRYQRMLDSEKESLEAIDALLENFLVGLEHVLNRHGSQLRPSIKKLLEQALIKAGRAIRTKRIKPSLELIQQEIEMLDVKVKRGVAEEDVNSEDDLPPELPRPAPE